MSRFIYEVEGAFGPDGPEEYKAETSKSGAGWAARGMAERGARCITVYATTPLPVQIPDGMSDSEDHPVCRRTGLAGIVRILNGKWRLRRQFLIEFSCFGEDEVMPGDIYSQVLNAKTPDAQD